jgi:hypothetical protein
MWLRNNTFKSTRDSHQVMEWTISRRGGAPTSENVYHRLRAVTGYGNGEVFLLFEGKYRPSSAEHSHSSFQVNYGIVKCLPLHTIRFVRLLEGQNDLSRKSTIRMICLELILTSYGTSYTITSGGLSEDSVMQLD